jgi:TRAP-type C4-dicarboxylate transport system permease large subunit
MVLYSLGTSGMHVTGPAGEKVSAASVGALFMAGVIPGILLAILLGLTTFYRAWKNGYPRSVRATRGERGRAFLDSFWGLALIVIIMGGIYGGLFTPTEAAAMSAVYAYVVAVYVYKDLKLADVPRVLLASAAMSAMILYIITNAILFSFLLTHEQIPQAIADWIVAQGFGWVSFLIVVNILLLAAGCVMEPASITLILAPILFPVAAKLGIDPVHFGIIMVVNMEIGMLTPPVGLNLYVTSGLTKLGLTEVSKAVLPWLATMLAFLVLVTYWPDLSLWLPRTLGMQKVLQCEVAAGLHVTQHRGQIGHGAGAGRLEVPVHRGHLFEGLRVAASHEGPAARQRVVQEVALQVNHVARQRVARRAMSLAQGAQVDEGKSTIGEGLDHLVHPARNATTHEGVGALQQQRDVGGVVLTHGGLSRNAAVVANWAKVRPGPARPASGAALGCPCREVPVRPGKALCGWVWRPARPPVPGVRARRHHRRAARPDGRVADAAPHRPGGPAPPATPVAAPAPATSAPTLLAPTGGAAARVATRPHVA